MTVRRSKEAVFRLDRTVLAELTRKVLEQPVYRDVSTTGSEFLVSVKPNFLLLGTPMRIVLEDQGNETSVTVSIESQSLILGDVFDFYNRYINDFLNDLTREVMRRIG